MGSWSDATTVRSVPTQSTIMPLLTTMRSVQLGVLLLENFLGGASPILKVKVGTGRDVASVIASTVSFSREGRGSSGGPKVSDVGSSESSGLDSCK